MTENSFKKRREYVYEELERARQRNPRMSNSEKSKCMKRAWKEAKRKYK